MARYPKSRENILKEIESQSHAIERGRELREKGFGFHCHPTWGNSVSIPSGEQFGNTRLNVRYSMVSNKGELEKAKEYLTICEEYLMTINDVERGYRLGN